MATWEMEHSTTWVFERGLPPPDFRPCFIQRRMKKIRILRWGLDE